MHHAFRHARNEASSEHYEATNICCQTCYTWLILTPKPVVTASLAAKRYSCTHSHFSPGPSGGPFQYKTLISTRMIPHSGTEYYHINENARVVNALDIIIINIHAVVDCIRQRFASHHDNSQQGCRRNRQGCFATRSSQDKEG